jgi:primosomal protein N' (replication factor Y)
LIAGDRRDGSLNFRVPMRTTLFVDVVLPLAIPNLLTYRVPFELNEEMIQGCRVVVQLGKTKLYTAVVRRVHEDPPQKYQAKYINSLLDATELVNERQFKLWEWLSGYYMCTLGEVMSAALPSSLKLASETKVVLDDKWDGDDSKLSDKEFLIVEALQLKEILSLSEISEILDQKTIQPIIKSLVEQNVVITDEELKQRYKPLTKDYVRLTKSACEDSNLQGVFDSLEKRAPKQLELLMGFFKLSGDVEHAERLVDKLKLQKAVGADASLVKKLVEKEVFDIESIEVDRLKPFDESDQALKKFSEPQEEAYVAVKENWHGKDVVLLHGVTGSGKTEIYVKLIEEALEQGKQVLYLLPEIALTTQIIGRLKHYFGERIGVYHSKFNQNERVEIWHKVAKGITGKYDIILGARSSVFLPFSNLGLIIVDEEHETSFKQFDPAPRYNARDTAVVLANLHGSKVLLGSATPAVETYHNATNGKYGLVTLSKRFGGLQLPEVQCADIRKELKEKTMKSHFSSFLLSEMERVLDDGEQIILFQNRRGYAPMWQCHMCGHVPQCTRCDVSLTYHKHSHQLKCHYCGYSKTPPRKCDACGSGDLKMLGFGTEKIEEELSDLLPEKKIARMDLDTTRSKHSYQQLINDFENGDIDILVGTQMVTKGLDFDNVSLVGVLNADQMLKFPDFRSSERSYQLMAQVAGRAGRKKKRGKVIIQTYTPDHWVIQKVMHNRYNELFDHEILERKNYLYPPFYRLLEITLKHKDPNVIVHASQTFANTLNEKLGNRVLGPEAPYVSRINNWYIRQVLVKMERETAPSAFKKIIWDSIEDLKQMKDFKSVWVSLDVDPM